MAVDPADGCGIINGIGHYWLPQFQPEDASPRSALGHPDRRRGVAHNHHALSHFGAVVEPLVRLVPIGGSTSAFSRRWGWRSQENRAQGQLDTAKTQCDVATLQAVITHRYEVLPNTQNPWPGPAPWKCANSGRAR